MTDTISFNQDDLISRISKENRQIIVEEIVKQCSLEEVSSLRDYLNDIVTKQLDERTLLLKGIVELEKLGISISDYLKPEHSSLFLTNQNDESESVFVYEQVDVEKKDFQKKEKDSEKSTAQNRNRYEKEYIVYCKSDGNVSYQYRCINGQQPIEIRTFLSKNNLKIKDIICNRMEAIDCTRANKLPSRLVNKMKKSSNSTA